MPSRHDCRALLAAALLLAIGAPRIAAAGTTYYVDARRGSDGAAGTSPSAAWRTLQRADSLPLQPGDSLLFARGSAYVGGFVVTASGTAAQPIVVGAYGDGGPAPRFTNPDWAVLNGNVVRVLGRHVIVDGLFFHDNTNPPWTADRMLKNVQKMGVVYFEVGADHGIVRHCEFVRSPVAVKVKAQHTLVTRNVMRDADRQMLPTWGPIAIMIVGPHNEISYNRITNYGYYGGAYGSDGGAIELDGVDEHFDGRDVSVHHNVSIGNHGFLELAGRVTDGITVAYNLSDDTDKFVGGGTMRNLRIVNNTVIRTREPNIDRWIFWTFYPDGTTMEVRNNIFVLPPDIPAFAATVPQTAHVRTGVGAQPHSHNLYFAPGGSDNLVGLPLGEGDLVADPRFVDAARGDYRLRADSPARDRGASVGEAWDVARQPVPAGAAPDIGAYEYRVP